MEGDIEAIKFYNDFCVKNDLDPKTPSVSMVLQMLESYHAKGFLKGFLAKGNLQDAINSW